MYNVHVIQYDGNSITERRTNNMLQDTKAHRLAQHKDLISK